MVITSSRLDRFARPVAGSEPAERGIALISVVLLLTGISDLWRFDGIASASAYRAISIAGLTARGVVLGCVIALAASGELQGKKYIPSIPTI